jgi:hypothetical protein
MAVGWGLLWMGTVNINVNINIPFNYWVFVPQVYFTSPRLYGYCVPRRQVVNVYQNTTILNNVYRVNNRAYAYGPHRDEIERLTRRSVPVYRVENSGRPGRDEIRNNSVGIYRPDMNRNERGNTYSRPDARTNTGTYEGGPRHNRSGDANQRYPQPQVGQGQSYPRPQPPSERVESVPQPERGNRRGGGYYRPENSSPSQPAPGQPEYGNQRGYGQPGGGQAREQRSGGGNEQRNQNPNQGQPPAQVQPPQGSNHSGGHGGPRGPR